MRRTASVRQPIGVAEVGNPTPASGRVAGRLPYAGKNQGPLRLARTQSISAPLHSSFLSTPPPCDLVRSGRWTPIQRNKHKETEIVLSGARIEFIARVHEMQVPRSKPTNPLQSPANILEINIQENKNQCVWDFVSGPDSVE